MHHFSGLAAPFVRSKGTISGGVFTSYCTLSRMVCRDFILPESASYVFFYAFSNLRNLLYIISQTGTDCIFGLLQQPSHQSKAKGLAARSSQTTSPFDCLNNFYFKILSNFSGSLQKLFKCPISLCTSYASLKTILSFCQGNSLQELNRIFHLIRFIFPIAPLAICIVYISRDG